MVEGRQSVLEESQLLVEAERASDTLECSRDSFNINPLSWNPPSDPSFLHQPFWLKESRIRHSLYYVDHTR